MNVKKLGNFALNRLDAFGYRLDSYGVTSKVNRHTLIAMAMAEQKHLEGEWDSLQARYGSQLRRFEKLTSRFRNSSKA